MIQGMAEYGDPYDPIFDGSLSCQVPETCGLILKQFLSYRSTLGEEDLDSSKAYDRRKVGCHGGLVHLLGQVSRITRPHENPTMPRSAAVLHAFTGDFPCA